GYGAGDAAAGDAAAGGEWAGGVNSRLLVERFSKSLHTARFDWPLTNCWGFPGRGGAGREPSCWKRTAFAPACPARLPRRVGGRLGRRWWSRWRASSGLPAL